MEGHPIPRQITTFEFKLIGFLTLRQFIYLIIFAPLGFIAYKLFPIPFINLLIGVLVGGIGPALAFVPINERPLDVWLRNFFKRLTSATQYVYHKENKPLPYFGNLFFVQDPHRVLTHIESQEKLAAYMMSKKKSSTPQANTKKQAINILFHTKVKQEKQASITAPAVEPIQPVSPQAAAIVLEPAESVLQPTAPAQPQQTAPAVSPSISTTPNKYPFFTGIVKNHKLIPLPGILIYVKNDAGQTLRLLKSNPHGVFATFSALSPAEYVFELKDPRGGYFFDTMKLRVENTNSKPFEFYSKELL